VTRTAYVTGAAGFIGSHLVDRLLERGCRVVGMDNLKLGRRANLEKALRDPAFELIEADVNDVPAAVERLRRHRFGPVGEVWHLAANSDIAAGAADPELDLRDTFQTTHSTLRLMERLSIPALVFASTSAIYGELDVPLKEDTGPLFPVSRYGAMKLASEAAIAAATPTFLRHAWIFRFPNVIGPRATHGVIFDFLAKLRKDPTELEVLGNGAQDKPYLYVQELIDAMFLAREKSSDPINCFNVSGDSSTTVKYIAERVVASAAPGARILYGTGDRGWIGDVPRFRYSTDKIRALGWRPKLSSNEAIDRTIRELGR